MPIDGHVTGLGRIRHCEFAMGVGEMSAEAFTSFLRLTLGHAAALARNGAIGLARLIEFDPAYCDTILRRYQRVTGKQATRAANGMSFEEIAQERAAPLAAAEEAER
jgi:hypothetical protein